MNLYICMQTKNRSGTKRELKLAIQDGTRRSKESDRTFLVVCLIIAIFFLCDQSSSITPSIAGRSCQTSSGHFSLASKLSSIARTSLASWCRPQERRTRGKACLPMSIANQRFISLKQTPAAIYFQLCNSPTFLSPSDDSFMPTARQASALGKASSLRSLSS